MLASGSNAANWEAFDNRSEGCGEHCCRSQRLEELQSLQTIEREWCKCDHLECPQWRVGATYGISGRVYGEVEGEHTTADGQQKYNLDGSGKLMVIQENDIIEY